MRQEMTIEQRLLFLERSNKQLKAGMLAIGILAGAVGILGAGLPAPKTITAERFVLMDDAGNHNLPVVSPENVNTLEDIGKLAPEAGYLLTAAFPSLTLEQADQILTETEGPGGGFLDDGSSFGVYSRLNLYAAAGKAAALASGQSSRARRD
jgi:hypothetical protein